VGDGAAIVKHACSLGCEGIEPKRLGSIYLAGRVEHWLKIKNPQALKREAEEMVDPTRSSWSQK
jgi:ATP-dependent DNA ligase